MNVNSSTSLRLFVCAVLVGAHYTPMHAEEPVMQIAPAPTAAPGASAADPYEGYLTPPAPDSVPNPVTEAGEAIFGRVFGVQGDGGDIKHHVIEFTTRTPSNAAVRSALVPGWGQGFNGETRKGILFFVTTTAAAVGSVVRYKKARDSYDDYKSAGQKDGSLYDDYEDEQLQSVLLGTAAVFLYGLGIVDAYRHGYASLYSQQEGLQLALSSDEGQVVWRKKF